MTSDVAGLSESKTSAPRVVPVACTVVAIASTTCPAVLVPL